MISKFSSCLVRLILTCTKAIPYDRVFGAELEVQFLMQECSNIVVKHILIKFIHFICSKFKADNVSFNALKQYEVRYLLAGGALREVFLRLSMC